MNLLHSRRVFDYVSRHLVCNVQLRSRQVAFTFDDGPNPAHTPRLLGILEKHAAHATFFLIGRNVQRAPELAAEIVVRGHEVGNHTHDHLPLPLLTRRSLVQQLQRASDAIHVATGVRPGFMRPPLGWFNRAVLHTVAEQGYRPVLGDVYPQDAFRPGTAAIVERVRGGVAPGSIVILHDGSIRGAVDRGQSIDAVEVLLPWLRDQGYAILSVSELLAAAACESNARVPLESTPMI